MTPIRQYTFLDRLFETVDNALRTMSGGAQHTHRNYPAEGVSSSLKETERKHSAGLMRVNHTGEVCAQALYHGQAFVSKQEHTRQQLHQAALEEGDHLQWCQRRLQSLESHTSYLNPLWYAGSFLIGMTAGSINDAVSLGFVAETETQVMTHLQNHLASLPEQDAESKIVLQAMHDDEAKHRQEAIDAGAATLPLLVRGLMNMASKIMVKTAYYL
jgi:ubiquinone biosynthesis monooxygenase Coq7